MKRLLSAMFALIALTGTTRAMSYEQARNEALFLTDKMAYELNLTDAQYDAAYEINLDYLMGVTTVDDVYGDYWTRRNLDMEYILLAWQWDMFRAATYFFRPLYWDAGCWHFGIYARYPRRSFFYFDRPSVYFSYRGGHSWRSNGGRSYYKGRQEFRGSANHTGMRDRWNSGTAGSRQSAGNSGSFSNRNSSKRNSGSTSSYGKQRSGSSYNRQGTGSSSYSRRSTGSSYNRQGSSSRYDGSKSSTRVTVRGNSSSRGGSNRSSTLGTGRSIRSKVKSVGSGRSSSGITRGKSGGSIKSGSAKSGGSAKSSGGGKGGSAKGGK